LLSAFTDTTVPATRARAAAAGALCACPQIEAAETNAAIPTLVSFPTLEFLRISYVDKGRCPKD